MDGGSERLIYTAGLPVNMHASRNHTVKTRERMTLSFDALRHSFDGSAFSCVDEFPAVLSIDGLTSLRASGRECNEKIIKLYLSHLLLTRHIGPGMATVVVHASQWRPRQCSPRLPTTLLGPRLPTPHPATDPSSKSEIIFDPHRQKTSKT